MKFKQLALKQASEQLNKAASLRHIPFPTKGWIYFIRKALGLSSYQLANKLGVNQSRIIRMESAEQDKSITLKTLENAANAMNCRLFYILLPESSLQEIVEKQVRRIAKKQLSTVAHSMNLEQQGLTEIQLNEQYEMLVQELLNGDLKKIWKDKA